MFRAIIHWVLSAIALMASANFFNGFYVNDLHSALMAALVISVLNATLGFALRVITFPFVILTFGIFLLFINATMIMLAGHLVEGFVVYGWTPALEAAAVLAVLGMALRLIMSND